MKNIFICFFLLLCSHISFASEKTSCTDCSFTGIVVDANTRKPVADVMIIARGIETGDEQKFSTDQQGQYKIPALRAGTYTIRFEKDNYKAIEKKNLIVKKTSAKLNVELVLEDGNEEDHHNWLLKFDII